MQSGSMLITNYLGEKTLLKVSNDIATSSPEENALIDAKAQLKREERNATVSEGNVVFLKEWIRIYSGPQVSEHSQVSEQSRAGLSEYRRLTPPIRLTPRYTKVPVLPRHA